MAKQLPLMWKELLAKLDITTDDPLLEQSVYQELFEIIVQEYLLVAVMSLHPNVAWIACHLMSLMCSAMHVDM